LIFLGLSALAVGCQPSAAGPGSSSDDIKLRADAAVQQCGSVSCAAGSVCCNASCGICTKPGEVCIQIACNPADAGKSCAELKCGVGETCMETRVGPQCVAHEESPCNLVDCAPNTLCTVVQGAAQCVPVASADAGNPRADAGSPRTDAGSVKPLSCAVTLCPPSTYCDDISGEAQCIKAPSCEGVRCEVGQHCALQEVQCIRAPCPPQPSCVPDTKPDACSTVRCAAGTHCELKQVQCIRAPCPPIAECVADTLGSACGKNTCAAGTFCCNASCGTCAPKGGACTQVFCPPES
jgi:hypothetical protein